MKILFNFCNSKGRGVKGGIKVPIDKWTGIDLICAAASTAMMVMIKGATADVLMAERWKDYLDFLFVGTLTIQWARFFLFFLCVPAVSKMLLTLINMMLDTVSFLCLVLFYLIMASAIFTTLYHDINQDSYGTVLISVRTLFDSFLAVYHYKGLEG